MISICLIATTLLKIHSKTVLKIHNKYTMLNNTKTIIGFMKKCFKKETYKSLQSSASNTPK